jgi:hypothetical protein
MALPVSFNEFKNNPVSAIAFIMLSVVGYLYYDSIATRKEILLDCKRANELQAAKIHVMERQVKRNDSLIAFYTYENQFYMNAIKSYDEVLLIGNKKK